MKAVVFAYHTMGAVGLRALARNGFEVLKVFTHQDDPGENAWFESVADLCRDSGIPFSTVEDVNSPEVIEEVRSLAPEIMFSFYYRKLLGPALLSIPPRGALNLHGSLLPRFRGRCPVNWVLVMGESKTGVTLHYMVEKPDAGDIVSQAETWIAREDTARTLFDKLAVLAKDLLDEALPLLREGKAPRKPMDLEQGSLFGGRRPEDGKIDWTKSSWEIYNLIRAVARPYPGAFSTFMGEKMIIWWAVPDDATAGLIHPREIEVEEGKAFAGARFGALRLEEIEWKGKVLKGQEIAEALEPHWREMFERD